MPRIACLVVPRFAIAALRRAEPELRGCPIAVCETSGGERGAAALAPHARILEVSAEAARRGVAPGLTLAQGLARFPDLVARPLDAEALQAAGEALLDVGRSVSPRVEAEPSEAAERGVLYVEIDGTERLFGSTAGVMSALLQRAARIGLEAGVAIADGKSTARIAAGVASRRGEALLVPAGGDASWLAPLPLAALAPAAEKIAAATAGSGASARRRSRRGWDDLAGELARLGIARVGDLAALPVGEVVVRFGATGARLWRVAAGCDDSPLVAAAAPPDLVEGMSLEHGVDSIEALLFVVRGLIDRVVSRLRLRGLACRGFTLAFALEDGAQVEREVGVLAPTSDVKSLVLLARAVIEASPPHAAIVAVRMRALADGRRADQLDFFRAAGPPSARLATALTRLAALCGQSRVGSPVPPAGHKPEAFSLSAFAPGEAAGAPARRAAPARGNGVACNGGEAARDRCADPSDDPSDAAAPSRIPLSLRALRPPRPAEVFLESGRIAYVRAPGLGGRTLAAAGPWRIEAEWWGDAPCKRDYWEVQLSDGGVYRLFRDAGRWWVDGHYD